MAKTTVKVAKIDNKNLHNRKNVLVLSINQNGKIVQFNKECERIFGYNRDDVLNKNFFDSFIPRNYFEQWEKIFYFIRQNKPINDFILPLLTQQGREVMVRWSDFPVGSIDGSVEKVGLMGSLVSQKDDEEEFLIDHKREEIKNKVNERHIDKKSKDKVLWGVGNKKLVLRKDRHTGSKDVHNRMKTKVPSKKRKTNNNLKHRYENKVKSKEKDGRITDKYNNLSKKYNDVKKTVKKLEMVSKELEKENKKLRENLKTQLAKKKAKQQKKSKPPKSVGVKTAKLFNDGTHFLFDCLGINNKREEFKRMNQEFDRHKAMLGNLEAQINADKKELYNKKNEFKKWREKLELLEKEVEERRMDLVETERMFNDQFASLLSEGFQNISSTGLDSKPSSNDAGMESIEKHAILDDIQESAAVIQRGKLKQVNNSFLELMGYETEEEIVDKSLIDFTTLKGLAEIKKHYLDRLKGNASSSYETIFDTKNDNEVAVEVKTRPTILNGEKAEIAVFKKLEDEIKKSN